MSTWVTTTKGKYRHQPLIWSNSLHPIQLFIVSESDSLCATHHSMQWVKALLYNMNNQEKIAANFFMLLQNIPWKTLLLLKCWWKELVLPLGMPVALHMSDASHPSLTPVREWDSAFTFDFFLHHWCVLLIQNQIILSSFIDVFAVCYALWCWFQIRDLNLGTNFPVIRAVTAKHVNLNPETSILEKVDINVEVEYNGGIQLAVDASSRFSKAAMVKIKGMFYEW